MIFYFVYKIIKLITFASMNKLIGLWNTDATAENREKVFLKNFCLKASRRSVAITNERKYKITEKEKPCWEMRSQKTMVLPLGALDNTGPGSGDRRCSATSITLCIKMFYYFSSNTYVDLQ